MDQIKENKITVGVEIPDQLHELIILMSVYLDTSKSQVIRNALDGYFENVLHEKNVLIGQLAQDAQIKWDKIKRLHSTSDVSNLAGLLTNFKKEEMAQLIKKGLSEEVSTEILNLIE